MTALGADVPERRFDVPGREGAGFTLAWAVRTDIGHRREVNEDSVIAEPPIFAVADGMGGHAAGDRASAAVVTRLAAASESGFVDVDQLDEALRRAGEDIDTLGAEHASGAGTTVTGAALALFEGVPGFLVFNIGDSRVYGLTAESFDRVTVDHSVVQELVDAGLLDAADAEHHPESNVVTRAVGFHEVPRPDLWGVPIATGLRLLVCSDGLTKEVGDAALRELLAERRPAAETADALLAAALDSGGRDNVSLIVLDVLDGPPPMRRRSARPAPRPDPGAADS